MTSALHRAMHWHAQNVPERPFVSVLGEYLESGVVWSSPELFLLARPALWDSGTLYLNAATPNAWFVYLAATSSPGPRWHPASALRLAPYPLPWLVWQRHMRGHYNAWPWHQLQHRQPRTKTDLWVEPPSKPLPR